MLAACRQLGGDQWRADLNWQLVDERGNGIEEFQAFSERGGDARPLSRRAKLRERSKITQGTGIGCHTSEGNGDGDRASPISPICWGRAKRGSVCQPTFWFFTSL